MLLGRSWWVWSPGCSPKTVRQRTCVTKIWPNFRVNFLVRFVLKRLFHWVLDLFRKFFGVFIGPFWGFGVPSCRRKKDPNIRNKNQPKEETLGRISLSIRSRTSVRPSESWKTGMLAWTSHADVHDKASADLSLATIHQLPRDPLSNPQGIGWQIFPSDFSRSPFLTLGKIVAWHVGQVNCLLHAFASHQCCPFCDEEWMDPCGAPHCKFDPSGWNQNYYKSGSKIQGSLDDPQVKITLRSQMIWRNQFCKTRFLFA